MQYREAGRRMQVLAYRGYDKEKRRALVKLLGSYDKYAPYRRSEGLTDSMTEEERTEFEAHMEALRQSAKERDRLHSVQYGYMTLDNLSDIVEKELCDSKQIDCVTVRLLESTERLTKALKRHRAKSMREAVKARKAGQEVHEGAQPEGATV